MPRQKSNDGAGLGKPIAFRLSEADRAAYLAKVEQSGMTQSEFFRQAVLTNRTQVIARPVASGDRKRLLYIFNKTSNNLNQIAHRAKLGARSREAIGSDLRAAAYATAADRAVPQGNFEQGRLNRWEWI